MATVLVSTLALAAVKSFMEPEARKGLETTKGRELYSSDPAETLTGCTVLRGDEFPQTTEDSPDPQNEPCYVHDDDTACEGYMVCCVTYGTCISVHGSTVSTNEWYYTGGCVSPESSAGALPDGCAKQGECHAMYLLHHQGASTKEVDPPTVETLDPCTEESQMEGSTGCSDMWTSTCGAGGSGGSSSSSSEEGVQPWLWAVIAVGALVVIGLLVWMMQGKKKADAGSSSKA